MPAPRPLFLATTALIAFATAAHALEITAAQTETISTTGTGGVVISATGSVQTVTSSAIEFNGTAADNTLTNYNTLGSAVSATIAATLATAGSATITNTGSILQTTPGVAAVDLGTMTTNGATLTNTGTISGSITLTGQADTFTQSTGGLVTGNLNMGNGDDTATVSGSTFTGNLQTGDGADTVTLTSTTLNGNLQTGNGASTVTLTDATISGEISDSTVGGDADILNIRGSAFTTQGAISGYESLNISTTIFSLNHGLTGVSELRNAAGSTFNVANSFTTAAGGSILNSGTLNIADGKRITTDAFTSTGTVGISVVSSRTAAGISATVGNVDLANSGLTITMGSNAGYIASGTQYVIATGAGGATTSGTLTNSSTGVYRYSTEVTGGNTLILTVGRVSTSSVVQGQTAQAIGDVLDTLGANTTGNLTTLQSIIGNQADAAGVQSVVESFGPGVDGAAVASINVTQATGNQVSQRLASLRDTGATGIATGDPMATNRMWVQGFANHVNQDDKDGASGYTADASGGSLGVDTDNWFEGITTGLAVSYGKTNVDSKSANNASTGINSYVATLYGSKVFRQGTFINAQFGGGYNDYDVERNVAGVGTANGTTNGWQATAKAEIGRDYILGPTTLTPLASLQYTHLNMSDYTESGLGGAGLHVAPGSMDTLDLGLGGRIAYGFALANGGTFTPSAHAQYIYRIGDTRLSTTSQFIGGGGLFTTSGVAADRSSINAGVGLLLSTIGGTDLSLDYDADIRQSLIGHAGQIKARWVF